MKYIILNIVCSLSIAVGVCHAESPLKKATVDSLWHAAVDCSIHGKFEESDSLFNYIIGNGRLNRGKTNQALSWLERNSYLSGNYKRTFEIRKQRFGDYQEDSTYFRILAGFPGERLDRPEQDVKIDFTWDYVKDKESNGGLIRIPVTIDGGEELFILDNGCSCFSAVSESFAREHHLNSSQAKGSSSGVIGTVESSLCYVDSISVGGIKFYNMVFSIIPDDPQMDSIVKIDAVLGANFFRLIGDVEFNGKEQFIVFPYEQQHLDSNVTINENGQHFVNAEIFGYSRPFQIDLGASSTSVNSNFYNGHKSLFRCNFTKESRNYGGIGGISVYDVYLIPELHMQLCGEEFLARDVDVKTQKMNGGTLGSGLIGNDIIKSFPESP